MDWSRKKGTVGGVEVGSVVRRFPSARKRIARKSHDLNLTGRHIPLLPLYMRALYTQIWHTMPPRMSNPLDSASQTYVQYMNLRDLCRVPLHIGDITEALWKDGTPEGSRR